MRWPRAGGSRQDYNDSVATILHLQKIMNAKQYIENELTKLKTPSNIQPEDDLEAQIVRLLLSKKFRKYSANENLINHIKESVHYCVKREQPINLTFLHGAYKLWRLEEAPETDWAELFSLMYYSKYVKPICEIYKPGVWFDFFVDDYIVETLDNYSPEEVKTYINSYQKLMDFLKSYQPKNLEMTITTVGSQFASREDFNQALNKQLEITPMPELSDNSARMVELNVRLVDGQSDDPKWREKIYRIHDAYRAIKGGTGYHKNRPDKILVFNQPLPSGAMIALGTTKSSIAKFWVGVGALKPDKNSYKMIVLSPSQLEKASFEWKKIDIGLTGKNFKRIRVIKAN